jgi:hypothetical protein
MEKGAQEEGEEGEGCRDEGGGERGVHCNDAFGAHTRAHESRLVLPPSHHSIAVGCRLPSHLRFLLYDIFTT